MDVRPLPFPWTPVPRVAKPTFQEHVAREYDGPVVLTGCLEDWRLLSTLRRCSSEEERLAALSGRIGQRQIRFTLVPDEQKGDLGFAEDFVHPNFSFSSGGRVPFARFAEQLGMALKRMPPPVLYMQAFPVAQLPELRAELGVLPYLRRSATMTTNLWVGSGGHVTNLHYDTDMNFICMLEGRKRVTLFPPTLLRDMYQGAFDASFGGTPASIVKLLNPDLDRFPRFRNALEHAQVALLEPGDVLYIPPLWWHHVESFGLNVMVNTFVGDIGPRALSGVLNGLSDAMVLFRPLPESTRALARELYRAWVFGGDGAGASPTPAGDGAAPSRETLHGIVDHLSAAQQLYRELPEYWRRQMGLFYDYFVFRIMGDPFPALPGEYDRMVSRMVASRRSLGNKVGALIGGLYRLLVARGGAPGEAS